MWSGQTAIYKRLLCLLSTTAFLGGILLFSPNLVEAAALLGPSDYFTDDRVNETNVVHNVSFVIPQSGHTIVPSDYIRIDFTNYSAVTAPTSGSGWTGSPTFGVTGSVAYVTNVSANPGQGIGISGITATNPAVLTDFDITIEITNDMGGSIVYDTITFEPDMMTENISTSVTISHENSSFQFIGFTSPSAFVTIMLNGGVAGTTLANSGGNFTKTISGLMGNENFSVNIFAQDTQLRQSQTVSFVAHTIDDATVIYSNIVIPTTIELDTIEVFQGDTLGILGRAHPLSQVTVFVGTGTPYSEVTGANSSGWWTYDFDSGEHPLGTGNQIAYAREVVQGGFTSIYTQTLPFTVNSCHFADINCDGRRNLTDFSIMLFYWLDVSPSNPRADISKDNVVNMTDFSILLYYWTG